jgi:UDP-glucuronate decarboxylase
MRKILVTGGAGNVAGSLSEALIKDPNNYVVIVDNLRTGTVEKLPAKNFTNWNFIKADVNNLKEIKQVFMENNFDVVFHYAALVGVQRTLENPLEVLNDITGIKNVLDLCVATNVKRIFYSSSSEVYGEPVEIPQVEETTPLNAKLPYAIVKNVGESYLKSYKQVHNLDYTIFRFFNTYGPKQSEDFVMAKFIKKALRNESIDIYGKGDQTRTFCFVDDNIDTTLITLNENKAINDTLNVGNDNDITILELAKLCIEKTNSKSELNYLPPLKEGDMKRRKPDVSKMKTILNRPLISLSDGIDKMIAHYKLG